MGFIAGAFGSLRAKLIGAIRLAEEKEDALIKKIKEEDYAPASHIVPVTDLHPVSGFTFSYDDYLAMWERRRKLVKKRRRLIKLSHRKNKSQRRRNKK